MCYLNASISVSKFLILSLPLSQRSRMPHHCLQSLKMLSLIRKPFQALDLGEIIFHVLQPTCYIVELLQTSLSFVGSGSTVHYFVGCRGVWS